MSDTDFTPESFSPPNPVVVAQWAGLLRTLVAVLAGMGMLGGAWAAVSAEQIANLLTAFLTVGGALMSVGVGVWSMWQKRAARRAEVAAARASALLRIPVTVTETPAGQENIAMRISAAEAGASPSILIDAQTRPAPKAV